MKRARWMGLAALLLALGCAVATGFYSYAKLTPARTQQSLSPGRTVETHGVRYRLDSFTVAESLPADRAGDPPVRGPAGSVIVLIVVTQTVLDPTVKLDEHFCDVTLVGAPGTRSSTVWETESDVTFAVRRPAAYGCGDTPSNPLHYGVERPTGFSFVIPAAAAAGITGRLSTDDDSVVIGLRP